MRVRRAGLPAAWLAVLLAACTGSAPLEPEALERVRAYIDETLPLAESALAELSAFVEHAELDAPHLRSLAVDLRRAAERHWDDGSEAGDEAVAFPAREEVARWTLVISRAGEDTTWLVQGRRLADAVWSLRGGADAIAGAVPRLLDGRLTRAEMTDLMDDMAELAAAVTELRAMLEAPSDLGGD